MQSTILAYMTDQFKTESKATVLGIEKNAKDGLDCVILDETIFYPQGGGQPWDTGNMIAASGKFEVVEVRFVDGFVKHYGTFKEGSFTEGCSVECQIDKARRTLNSRLHSAGHLLDEAVKNIKYPWIPTKGDHHPGRTAVEYSGHVEDTEAAREAIEIESNRLINFGGEIKVVMVDIADLPEHSNFIPPDLPANKPIRVVVMCGDKGTPCGGIHVKDIKDIGPIKIRYVKAKKGTIRVAYELASDGA